MKKYLNSVSLIFIILVCWQVLATIFNIPKYILPTPNEIFVTFFEIFPVLIYHSFISLQEALSGLLIAFIISIILSILMDFLPCVKKATYNLLILSQTIPIIYLAPLIVMWFGFGLFPKILVVVLVCFFPIVINFTDGLSRVDKQMIDLMRSMGAGYWTIFLRLKLPYCLPDLLAGLKIAVTYCLMGAIIGEWLGGKSGLGVYMLRVKQSFAIDKVFAAILMISLLSIILFKLVDILATILMPYKKEKKEKK